MVFISMPQCSVILVIVYLCRSVICVIPEDLKARRIISTQETEKYLTFRGTSTNFSTIGNLTNIQEVKLLDKNNILVTAKDSFYVIKVSSLTTATSNDDILYTQRIPWPALNTAIDVCRQKTASIKECHNYIRVASRVSNDSVLLCGTNALSPQCRYYQWSSGQFTGDKMSLNDDINAMTTPFYKDLPLSYKYSDGNMYTGTQLSFGKHPTVTRVAMPEQATWDVDAEEDNISSSMPFVRSDQTGHTVFKKPHFAGSIDVGQKILFFFRETAIEQFGIEDLEYSRVAQVCKTDRGGSSVLLKEKWTSFFKARLNCSSQGDKPFYFNEIQHISDVVSVGGQPMVFATMTTPENSIRGSAVCSFTLDSIRDVFLDGFFKYRTESGSTCFSSNTQPAPIKHSTICPKPDQDTRLLETPDLAFRRKNVLMGSVVQPLNNKPLFIETQSRHVITSIAVDKDLTEINNNYTFMYLGTDDGRILKVLTSLDNQQQNSTVLSEEIFVYSSRKCLTSSKPGDGRVLKVVSVANANSILVVFTNCIVSVPKHRCPEYSCKTDCVQSGNPYCGWVDQRCVDVTGMERKDYEQDLFTEKEKEKCKDHNSFAVASTTCRLTSTVVAVIVCVCFIVLCVVALVFYKLQHIKKFIDNKHDAIPNNMCKNSSNFTVEHSSQSLLRRGSSNTSNNSRRIYTGPKNDIRRISNSSTLGRNPSFNRQAPSIPPPLPPNQSSSNNNSNKIGSIPSEASYESLKSVSWNARGKVDRTTSDADNIRRFHGVNIVENIKSVKTSPPPRHVSKELGNSNNNNTSKIIGVATAMARSESPVRRRCRSSHEDDFNALVAGKNNKSTNLGNPKVNNHVANTQQRSLPSPVHIYDTPKSSVPMVAHYNVIPNRSNRTFNKCLSEEPDYENIQSPDQPQMQAPEPPAANKGRKLSSFTNTHFNTAWFPTKSTSDDATEISSGCGTGSSQSSLSDHANSNSNQIHASSTTSNQIQRSVAPPRDLNIKHSNNVCNFTPGTNKYYSEVCNNDAAAEGTIPIHYEDDSAFFNEKQASSEDDGIMKDLDEVMSKKGCTKHSNKKRKKNKNRKDSRATDTSSPSDCEQTKISNILTRMQVSGLPYVLSDEEHIYETPSNISAISSQAADDFDIGNKRGTENSWESKENFAFHTMRPPGRRRQKLPRLRNSEQKDEHRPLAVPTPVIPN